MDKLKIHYIPINDLIPAEYNPRQMTEKQVKDLTESIKRFGLVDPLIVNKHPERKNIIIGGHMRWKIAKELGIDIVPCVFIEVDEQQEKELNLRLNRNLGEWDFDLLASFDGELLKAAGWQQFEINRIFQLDINDPKKEWSGMPEFEQEDSGIRSIEIHFKTEEAIQDFAQLLNQKITGKTKRLWFPKKDKDIIETEE